MHPVIHRENTVRIAGTEPPADLRASRAWRVLHADDSPQRIAHLIASLHEVGMRPSVFTRDGEIPLPMLHDGNDASIAHDSLLNAWNHVRQWRRVFVDAGFDSAFELLHAHTFASGMAGVRNCPVTVYSMESFIEDFAANAGEHASWLSRSFRVAEQFVLARAAAVVVPRESLRSAAIHRGVAPENIFAIPRPLDPVRQESAPVDEEWLQSRGVDRWHRVLIYAPEWRLSLGADGNLSEDSRALLDAFAMAASEEEGAYLMVESDESARAAAQSICESMELPRVIFIDPDDRLRAFAAAHIIVAAPADPCDASASLAERALLDSKALLAADVPCHRDATPSGRGCLWFRGGDPRDLAYRMAFLARNRDFRLALADSGQRFLAETRSPASIALQYDRVYRHAIARRKSGGLQTPAAMLTPAPAIL